MITTLPGSMGTQPSDNVDSTHTLNPIKSMRRQMKLMRNVTSLPTGMKTSAHKPIFSKPTIFDRKKMNIPQVREFLDLQSIFSQAYADMIIEMQFGPSSGAAAPIGSSGPMQKDITAKSTFHQVSGGTSLVNKQQSGPNSRFNMNPKTMLKPYYGPKDNTSKRTASWSSSGVGTS